MPNMERATSQLSDAFATSTIIDLQCFTDKNNNTEKPAASV